jgi:FkbM family methyltransferase
MKKISKKLLGHKIVKKIVKLKLAFFPYLLEEPKETVDKRQKFYSQFINPKDIVFDVGANVGNRTRVFLNIGAKVLAIEPQKECYQLLEKRFKKSIEIVRMGVGEKEEMKDFFVASTNTVSSFSTEWIDSVKKGRLKDYSWEKPIKIQITTLDRLIKKYGLPKFIKIDVEGYELEVLRGLTQSVDVISFEYTVPEQIQKVKDCIEQIERYNSEIECNFSTGESMVLEFQKWQSSMEFKKFISTKEFISTGFGDIYVKNSSKNTRT